MIKNGQPQVYAILKVWKMLGSFDEQLSQGPISAASPKKRFKMYWIEMFHSKRGRQHKWPKIGRLPSRNGATTGAVLSAPPIFLVSRGKILLLRRPFSVAVSLWLICALLWDTNSPSVGGGVHVHIKWSLLDSESGLRLSSSGFLLAAFSPTVAVSLQPSHSWAISLQVSQRIFMEESKNVFIKICQTKHFYPFFLNRNFYPCVPKQAFSSQSAKTLLIKCAKICFFEPCLIETWKIWKIQCQFSQLAIIIFHKGNFPVWSYINHLCLELVVKICAPKTKTKDKANIWFESLAIAPLTPVCPPPILTNSKPNLANYFSATG